jgi:hypothetical protein
MPRAGSARHVVLPSWFDRFRRVAGAPPDAARTFTVRESIARASRAVKARAAYQPSTTITS